jgi:molecular chaperone DnaJ
MGQSRQNLFAVLQLDVSADEKQIKDAYRKLAKKYHPDLNPNDPRANDNFKDIAHAYWILSDPGRRRAYLQANPSLRPSRKQSADFKDVFASAKSGTTTKSPPKNGKDILVRLYVTLEELYRGTTRKVKLRRRESCESCRGTGIYGGAQGGICPACRGTGEVPDLVGSSDNGSAGTIPCRKCGGSGFQAMKACPECSGSGNRSREITISVGVPPGTAENETIVVKGQGHQAKFGGSPGDLRVVICQKDHPYLERRHDDLIYYCSITFTQWLEGCELQIPSLNGSLALKIKPKSTPEGALKIHGRGMPGANGKHGDLIVKYSLSVPDKLSVKQKLLLKTLESTRGFAPRLDEHGWCPRKPQPEDPAK